MIKVFHVFFLNLMYLNAFFFTLSDYWSIRCPFPHTLTGGRTPGGAQAVDDKDLGISVSVYRNLRHLEPVGFHEVCPYKLVCPTKCLQGQELRMHLSEVMLWTSLLSVYLKQTACISRIFFFWMCKLLVWIYHKHQ